MSTSLTEAVIAPFTGESANPAMVALVWLALGVIIDRTWLHRP